MEIFAKTGLGNEVCLRIGTDEKYGFYRVECVSVTEPEKFGVGNAYEYGKINGKWGVKVSFDKGPALIQIKESEWLKIKSECDRLNTEKNREEIHLVPENHSGNLSHVKGYSLSARLSHDDWSKIKHLMVFHDMSIDDDIWSGERFKGWVVKDGHELEIEDILGVKPENRIAYRIQQAESEKKAAAEKKAKIKALKNKFREAEYPDPSLGWIEVDGEEFGEGANIYGGGWWFVIQQDRIWYIQNNGHDGDDWSRNNVRTGGAGAIGVWLPYDGNLASEIKSVCT